MLPRLTNLGRTALELLFPCWCLGCGREGSLICPSCCQKLPLITSPIRSPFRFEGVIRQAIHQIKYKILRAITEPLAELLANYLTTHPVFGEVLVPMPLHSKRLRERGYNQSDLLSKELDKLIRLPVRAGCIARNRNTPTQTIATSTVEKRSNVAAAFACLKYNLQNKEIILIDDVATSGAMLNACATALKGAGATAVWGLTIAREVKLKEN